MKFGAHYLPTYVPDLDGPSPEFYRRMFEQIEELDRLGFDHVWVTEPLAKESTSVVIDKEPRRWEKPSDHAPVVAELRLN